MSLPPPLAEFPVQILEGLRKEGPHDPTTLREWVLILSGWLFRLAHLEAESMGSWLDASLIVEEKLSLEYQDARNQGMSVSAAEKHAKMSISYLAAKSVENKTETLHRHYANYFKALTEAINAAKHAGNTSMTEMRHLGIPHP